MTDQFDAPPLHHADKPPTRVTNDLTISVGAISVPCSLYAGIGKGPNPAPRQTYTPAGNPAGYQWIDTVTEEVVEADDLVKKATASDGETLVDLDDDEIMDAYERAGVVSGEVTDFVPLARLTDGTYVVDGHCQIRPAKVKKRGSKAKKPPMVEDPRAGKAFNLILQAMEAEGVFALMKLVRRATSVPRWAGLLPDGRLLVFCFNTQVRQPRALPVQQPSEAEVAMARSVIQAVGVREPVLVSAEGEGLLAYVDAKAAGQIVKRVVTDDEVVEVEDDGVDLMAALEASLAVAAVKSAPGVPAIPPLPTLSIPFVGFGDQQRVAS